jgi:transcriptional regulator GlxA family with amidase domain
VIQIISQEAGPLVAAQTARAYTIFGQRSGQLPFSEWQPKIDHGDSAITRAQMWIDEQYAAQDVLPGAIEASTLADRTFKRRFKAATGLPPTHYLQRVRVEEARMLLETTNMNVEAVAVHVGYFDTAFFRNLFKKFVGLKPSEYRERFSLFSERSQEAEDELGRAVA